MIGNRVINLLIVATLALAGQTVLALELGQDCVNPVGEAGKCVLFRECQPLVDIYNKPVNTPDDTYSSPRAAAVSTSVKLWFAVRG